MEVVLFIGIQACGKSTFFREKYFHSHIRINMDMLRTRHRERLLFQACLEAKQPVVIDNTNVTRKDRERYILPAKEHGFSVKGMYFASKLRESLARNALREGKARIPDAGIVGTFKKLEVPHWDEGFDSLHYVTLVDDELEFRIEDWMEP